MSEGVPLFVYGLLMPGLELHHVVEPFIRAWSPGQAAGRLYESRGVPAARFDEDGLVSGVVLWLDPVRIDAALAVLDDVEDEGTEYDRITVRVRLTEASSIEAYAYQYRLPLDGSREVGPSWAGL